jgi:hypothetical protein
MNFNNKPLYFSTAILIIVLILGSLQSYFIANIFALISCFFLLSYDKKAIIALYIILLPTNGLFSTENNLLGLLSPVTISQLFAFIVLISWYVNRRLSPLARISILIIIGLFLFNVIYDFKNAYFNIYDLTFDIAIKRFIKNLFRFSTLFLLVKLLDRGFLINVSIKALHIGIVFLILSSIFTEQFSDLGFLTTDASEEIDIRTAIVRRSGFFAFGDVNSLGGMLASYAGFLILWYNKQKGTTLFLILFLITLIGILYTGSRTALAGLVFVILATTLISWPNSNSFFNFRIVVGALVLVAVIFFIFPSQIELFLSRFEEAEQQFDISHEGTRVYKWIVHLEHLAQNPDIWLLGTNKVLMLDLGGGFTQARVPHNFYLTIAFQTGFFLLFFFVYIWFKLSVIIKNNTRLIIIAVPIFFISFYVSDWGYFQYFALFLPIVGAHFKDTYP